MGGKQHRPVPGQRRYSRSALHHSAGVARPVRQRPTHRPPGTTVGRDRDGGFAVLAPPGHDEKVNLLRTVLAADAAGTWINEFLETSDDQVWIATNAGLARVRPQAIDNHASPSTELVPLGVTAGALSLAEDRSRNLWVGTQTGAAHVLTAGFAVFSGSEGVPAASSLMETPDGVLVAMTAGATREGASVVRRSAIPIDSSARCCGGHELGMEPGLARRPGS